MSIALRAARADDAPAVAALYLEARARHLPYAPLAHAPVEVRAWIAHALLPGGGVTVAQAADGALLGFIAVSRDDDGHAWIDQLYVDAALIGRGVGACLLAHALGSLPRPVRLHCFAANSGARRFYERRGFTAIAFGDGSGNEEQCPDVLYELAA